MATYISNIQDYIPTLQPFRPDLNFMGNILQAKQSKYDVAKNQISSIYGSMLNSPLSRDTNIKKRDEFFKNIDEQIHQISGLDLSLQQNQEYASNVFNSLLDDKGIKKDMVWTKNFMNEVDRAEGFKLCIDPDKCGGKYWDGGVEELMYRRNEFQGLSDEEAMGYGDVSFTPAQDLDGKALKFIKDNKLDIKYDQKQGGYIVTHKNGQQSIAGLQSFMMSTFGNDPAMKAYFKSQAFLQRMNTTGGDPMQDASYINTVLNQSKEKNGKEKSKIQESYDVESSLLQDFIRLNKEQGISADDNELIEDFRQKYGDVEVLKQHLQILDNEGNIISNTEINNKNMRLMGDNIDDMMANALMGEHIGSIAYNYAMTTQERSVKADPYSLAEHKLNLDMKKDAYLNGTIDEQGNYKPGKNQLAKEWLYNNTTGKGSKSNTPINDEVKQNYFELDAGTRARGLIKAVENTNLTVTVDNVSELDGIQEKTKIVVESARQITSKIKDISSNFAQTAIKGLNAKIIAGDKNASTFNDILTKIEYDKDNPDYDLVAKNLSNFMSNPTNQNILINTDPELFRELAIYNTELQNANANKRQVRDIMAEDAKITYETLFHYYGNKDDENAIFRQQILSLSTSNGSDYFDRDKKEAVLDEVGNNMFKKLKRIDPLLFNDPYYKETISNATQEKILSLYDELDKTYAYNVVTSPFDSRSFNGLGKGSSKLSQGYTIPYGNNSDELNYKLEADQIIDNAINVFSGSLNNQTMSESSGFDRTLAKIYKAKVEEVDTKGASKNPLNFNMNIAPNAFQDEKLIGAEVQIPSDFTLLLSKDEKAFLNEIDNASYEKLIEGDYNLVFVANKDAIQNNAFVHATKPNMDKWLFHAEHPVTYKAFGGSTFTAQNIDGKVKIDFNLSDGNTNTKVYDSYGEYLNISPSLIEKLNNYDFLQYMKQQEKLKEANNGE